MGSQLSFFPYAIRGSMHEVGEFYNQPPSNLHPHWEEGLEGGWEEGNPFNRFWISGFRFHEDWYKGSTTKEKPWEWLRLFRILTWKGQLPWFTGRKILFLKMVQDQMLGSNFKCQMSNSSGRGFNVGSW